jgi:N-ethylmaleimide reductase
MRSPEAVNISEQAIGSPFTPGIYTEAQTDSWQRVTEAVHEVGGKIFMQLWHTGRVGHSAAVERPTPCVAPSAIAIEGQKHFTSQGLREYEVPRALETEEVKAIISDYTEAARKAKLAGFDGAGIAMGHLAICLINFW